MPPERAPPPRMRDASTTSYSPEANIEAIAGSSFGVYW
jgi:hypothetical protein